MQQTTIDLTHHARLQFFKGDSATLRTRQRRAYDRARYLVAKAQRITERASRTVTLARDARLARLAGADEPIGPQAIPAGMIACPTCDILTRRPDVCGYCAAEAIGAVAA